ncbi:hypothetical protein [Kitasatospora saccharophila]
MAKTATPASGVRRRMVRLGITAVLALAPLAGTVGAHAAPAAPKDRMPKGAGVSAVINDGTVTGGNSYVHTDLSSGTLSFWSENGARYGQSQYSAITAIQYQKNSGGQIHLQFFYNEGGNSHPDEGAFYQSAGETRSYSWGFVSLPANCSAVGKMKVDGQGEFLTPPDHPC